MNTREKIALASTLSSKLGSLESFLIMLLEGGAMSEYERFNTFCELSASSYIWTGKDNPKYYKGITDPETISECANAMVPIIKSKIESTKEEINKIIK